MWPDETSYDTYNLLMVFRQSNYMPERSVRAMKTDPASKRSVMVVRFDDDPDGGASAGGVAPDGGAPTLTCTACGASGYVSGRRAATANGDIDGVRRDVKCTDCAGASDRRSDVTS